MRVAEACSYRNVEVLRNEQFTTGPHAPRRVSRRDFIKFTTGALIPFVLPRAIFGDQLSGLQNSELVRIREKPRNIIFIFLDGGASNLETFDPRSHVIGDSNFAPDEIRGDFGQSKSDENTGVRISKLLPEIQKRMGHAALIRTIKHDNFDHDQAYAISLTGSEVLKSRSGAIPLYDNPFVSLSKDHYKYGGFITLHTHSRYNPGGPLQANQGLFVRCDFNNNLQYTPQFGTNFNPAEIRRRLGFAQKLWKGENLIDPRCETYGGKLDQALELIESGLLKAFEINDVSEFDKERYGMNIEGNSFATACFTARQLIEKSEELLTMEQLRQEQVEGISSAEDKKLDGVGVVSVSNPYWDDHNKLKQFIVPRTHKLDKGVSALIDDIVSGRLENTILVLSGGEFGRTFKIDPKTEGRHHWPHSNFLLVVGPEGVIVPGVRDSTDRQGFQKTGKECYASQLGDTIVELIGFKRINKETGLAFEGFSDYVTKSTA